MKAKTKYYLWILHVFISVACCCGLCVPSMFITKATAEKSVGVHVLFHRESESRNPKIFSVCNRYLADNTVESSLRSSVPLALRQPVLVDFGKEGHLNSTLGFT